MWNVELLMNCMTSTKKFEKQSFKFSHTALTFAANMLSYVFRVEIVLLTHQFDLFGVGESPGRVWTPHCGHGEGSSRRGPRLGNEISTMSKSAAGF